MVGRYAVVEVPQCRNCDDAEAVVAVVAAAAVDGVPNGFKGTATNRRDVQSQHGRIGGLAVKSKSEMAVVGWSVGVLERAMPSPRPHVCATIWLGLSAMARQRLPDVVPGQRIRPLIGVIDELSLAGAQLAVNGVESTMVAVGQSSYSGVL